MSDAERMRALVGYSQMKVDSEIGTQKMRSKLLVLAKSFLLFALLILFLPGCIKNKRPKVEPIIEGKTAIGPIDDIDAEATRIIRGALADEHPLIRVKAIEVVAMTDQIQLMPRVRKLMADDFVPVRFAAALAVGDLEYSFGKDALSKLLADENDNVKIAAAYSLGKLGSYDSFKVLSNALASKDQTVRANAAMLLGKSGDKRALKLLYFALRLPDSDDRVRFQAVESIAMLHDERIYPKIWSLLISTYADDRVIGIRAMGTLGTTQARDTLITKLDDDVLEVRLAAAEQLGMLGDKTGQAEVLDVFKKRLTAKMNPREREHVYMLTALAIGEIGTESLTKYLPDLLRNESKMVRIAAAKAVFLQKKGQIKP